MTEKAGRNDPCPCGSGKKYKQCCMKNEKTKSASYTPQGVRKFTAKVLSGGGAVKPESQQAPQSQNQAAANYQSLMDRSFGSGIHNPSDTPPLPENPDAYLPKQKSSEEESK